MSKIASVKGYNLTTGGDRHNDGPGLSHRSVRGQDDVVFSESFTQLLV